MEYSVSKNEPASINERGPAIPIPKWQKGNTNRVSSQKLLQKLRSEIWTYAMERFEVNSSDFATDPANNTKSQESEFQLESVAFFARAG